MTALVFFNRGFHRVSHKGRRVGQRMLVHLSSRVLHRVRNICEMRDLPCQMETFLKFVGFILTMHVVESPEKAFGK